MSLGSGQEGRYCLLWERPGVGVGLGLGSGGAGTVSRVPGASACNRVCSLAVEIATLTRENGKTVIRVLKQKEVEQLIKNHEEEEAKAEREKKEKEQKEKDK